MQRIGHRQSLAIDFGPTYNIYRRARELHSLFEAMGHVDTRSRIVGLTGDNYILPAGGGEGGA